MTVELLLLVMLPAFFPLGTYEFFCAFVLSSALHPPSYMESDRRFQFAAHINDVAELSLSINKVQL